MKVALCFIISYEHILQKEHIWIDWIKSNQDIINVYFHYKDSTKIKSPWIKKYIIPKKYIKKTSYYHVVPAYMALLSYAYFHDKNNKWFCVLTDSCCPIISPDKFRKLFFNYCDKSIIQCKPAYWNVEFHNRANLKHLNNRYHLANDPWFTLCRYHVYLCLLFVSKKNDIYRLVNSGGLSNESLFAIILETFNELSSNKKIINSSSNVSDWSRMSNPTSPYLFKFIDDNNYMIINDLLKNNPYAMFIRKIHYECPSENVIKIINKNYSNEKYNFTIYNNIYSHIHYFIFILKNNKNIILYLFFTIFTIVFTKIFMNF